MTDRNGKPLKEGDKVTYDGLPGQVGTVTATRRTVAVVRFRGTNGKPCRCAHLTLVAPKPKERLAKLLPPDTPKIDKFAVPVEGVEHTGTNVFEALERPDAAELFAKAELVSRVRDIMDGFERSRFLQVADEILKAVRAYREP